MPVCETSDFPPRSFPVFNGATALLVWQEVQERTLPAGLFTDCKSMCYWCSFLYLNFYCIFYDSVVVYISIFWKRDLFFLKTYYSGFLVANFAFSVLFFCHAVYHITKTDFFFSASLSFHHFPKATLGPQTTFPYLFESFSIKEQTFAFLSPLLICTI